MLDTFRRAHDHDGTAFVEIYQNCNVFNDGAFGRDHEQGEPRRHADPAAARASRSGSVRTTRSASPSTTQGNPRHALVADVGEDAVLVHDEARDDPSLAFMLSRLARGPNEPTPIGVFRAVTRPEYADATSQQLAAAVEQKGPGDLGELLHSGATWTI